MNRQSALDRRRHVRRKISLMVRYHPREVTTGYDITQTRDLSQGGMLVTTAMAFAKGARLTVRLTLPAPRPRVPATVEAVDSREVVENLIYETRVRFIDLHRWSFRMIGELCTRGFLRAGGERRLLAHEGPQHHVLVERPCRRWRRVGERPYRRA